MNPALPGLHYYTPVARTPNAPVHRADIVIYGANSAGVAAAVAARRLGKTVRLVEQSHHVGGLSSGGLGATDIGNKAAIGGISREFYRRLGAHYGKDEAWTFEPSVAERLFLTMLAEVGVEAELNKPLKAVRLDGHRITRIETEDGTAYEGSQFIDCTYEGDLMALAGVSYTVGRESNAKYDEIYNGVCFGHPNHNIGTFIDPYVTPGDPSSGLLPGVFPGNGGKQGDGDHRVQAYNFRLCMSRNPNNRKPFPKPDGYDPRRFELLRRLIDKGVFNTLRLTIAMPNDKTDTNNWGGVSSDNIGMNYDFPDGSYARREEIFQDHVRYHAGMMWFLQNDPRLPAAVHAELAEWGLPLDEFPATGGWPHQLYIREARRMVSDYVMTEHDCVGRLVCNDAVALAAYTMDSHNCNRIVRGGRVINEGNVEITGFPPYPISYRSIVPRRGQCENLFVPVCLSASHIAYGSIRMEPVFMITAQASATAAVLAIDAGVSVQDVSYDKLRTHLLGNDQLLQWDSTNAPLRKN